MTANRNTLGERFSMREPSSPVAGDALYHDNTAWLNAPPQVLPLSYTIFPDFPSTIPDKAIRFLGQYTNVYLVSQLMGLWVKGCLRRIVALQ